jgi:hypothetical protein
MAKITQTYYVSTGRLNAMYTLRCTRQCEGLEHVADLMPDFYICNLASTEDKAIEKAREYVAIMRHRIGETDDFKIKFDEFADREAYKRRGKLSVKDTRAIESIEAGVFPFGKKRGEIIAEADADYLMYFADKLKDADEPVFAALCGACALVCMEKGYLQARADQRAAHAAASVHIGTKGERLDFDCVIAFVHHTQNNFGPTSIYGMDHEGSRVMYFGTCNLGEKGDRVQFTATIKDHTLREGMKQTIVARPSIIKKIPKNV